MAKNYLGQDRPLTEADLPQLYERLANTQDGPWDNFIRSFRIGRGVVTPRDQIARSIEALQTGRKVRLEEDAAEQNLQNSREVTTGQRLLNQDRRLRYDEAVATAPLHRTLTGFDAADQIVGAFNGDTAAAAEYARTKGLELPTRSRTVPAQSRWQLTPNLGLGQTTGEEVVTTPARQIEELIARPESAEKPIELGADKRLVGRSADGGYGVLLPESRETVDNGTAAQLRQMMKEHGLTFDQAVEALARTKGGRGGGEPVSNWDSIAPEVRAKYPTLFGSTTTPVAPKTAASPDSSAIAALKQKAKAGDAKAQAYLKTKGITY
jgi:hypothetical protein